jgi:hypothetical protein
MRPISVISNSLFFISTIGWGQQPVTKNYRLVLSNYVFTTETSFERDTLNGNSSREYSCLFKDSHQIINIPRRIDTIAVYSISDPDYRRIRIDTVERLDVNKIVDTISKSQLNQIINSEIQVYRGSDKLKFNEAQFEAIKPDGRTSYTIGLQKANIKEGKIAFKAISDLEEGGFLILYAIWFYDLENNRHEIECNIAWMIK